LLPPVVCLIVGLHFLPLARLYDQPQYRWTAGLLILAAVIGLGAVLWGAEAETVLGGVGFAAAMTLWASAVHVAIRNRSEERRVGREVGCWSAACDEDST